KRAPRLLATSQASAGESSTGDGGAVRSENQRPIQPRWGVSFIKESFCFRSAPVLWLHEQPALPETARCGSGGEAAQSAASIIGGGSPPRFPDHCPTHQRSGDAQRTNPGASSSH